MFFGRGVANPRCRAFGHGVVGGICESCAQRALFKGVFYIIFVGYEVFLECFFKPDRLETKIQSFSVSLGIVLDVSSALSLGHCLCYATFKHPFSWGSLLIRSYVKLCIWSRFQQRG